MGFSLFKKKNKDKTAPPSPLVPPSPNQRLSVPPNVMKGAYSPSPAGSPRVAGTPSFLNSPALSVNEWGQTPSMTNSRRIKLRCVLDPLPNTAGNMKQDVNNRGEALKELFYISAELDAPIDTLRRDITHELGVQGKFSVGVYKVSIPWAAHYQSRTYSHRYALPAHLLAHFPSFNLDDPEQLNASYCIQPTTQHLLKSDNVGSSAPSETTVEDWWPEGIDNKDGVISLLVRLGEVEEEDVPDVSPLTLMVHFANQDVKPVSSLLAPPINHMGAFVVEDDAPCPPLALEISRDATVSELKEAILKADGRPVGLLEKIKLWKVDMTWKEMIDCEAMGDGQNSSMPWPYSPDAPDSTPLQDMIVPLDAIFPAYKSNTNAISIFVWIHPSALGILTRSKDLTTSILGESIPNFQYPMKMRRHASKLERQTMLEKNKIRTITAQMENGSGTYGRRPSLARHGRPNTAPSSAASSPGSSPTLSPMLSGRKGILKRSSSGLPSGYTASQSLNMAFTNLSMTSMYRSPGGSVSSSNVTSPMSSDSEDSAFSSVPHTPLASVLDLRISGDLITSVLPGPSKTVRWSETTDIARKKAQLARAVTIVEGDEVERDEMEDLSQQVRFGLAC